jgi:hypothetical protein
MVCKSGNRGQPFIFVDIMQDEQLPPACNCLFPGKTNPLTPARHPSTTFYSPSHPFVEEGAGVMDTLFS